MTKNTKEKNLEDLCERIVGKYIAPNITPSNPNPSVAIQAVLACLDEFNAKPSLRDCMILEGEIVNELKRKGYFVSE
ncbi:MAG: hypothetical protein K9J28_09315 [Sulfuritalea sp.]|nr:hypothetical protein [Sulfuritalea sp.]